MKKKAFVLMPFAEEFSDVYDHLIYSCLIEAGYDVKRADDIKSQNNILKDIIEGIVESDLIVSDLTGANANVYYELGIAHTLNKKVILITQEIDELPFDLRSYRVIGYSTYLSKMNRAREELLDLAKDAFEGNLPFGNPVNDFGNLTGFFQKPLNNVETEEGSNNDGLGIIDYRIMLEEGFEKMANIVREVGDKLRDETTPEIQKATSKLTSGTLTTKEQRDVIQKLALFLEEYAVFMTPKNDQYRLVLKDVRTGLENIIGMYSKNEVTDDKKGLSGVLKMLQDLEDSATLGRKGFVELVEAMEALPEIEENFNRSNKFMISQIKTFVDNIDQTLSVVSRVKALGVEHLVEKK